jgi:hypothetical protein
VDSHAFWVQLGIRRRDAFEVAVAIDAPHHHRSLIDESSKRLLPCASLAHHGAARLRRQHGRAAQ